MFSVTQFSTAGLRAKDQFDAWRSLHKDTIEFHPTGAAAEGFDAAFSSWNLGQIVLTRAVFSGAPARQWRHRPKSYLDYWCVVLARGLAADGTVCEDLSFRSLTLPFEGKAQDSEVITLYLPRDRSPAEEQRFDRAHGLAVSGALAPLLCGYMDGLVRCLPHVTAEYAAKLEMPTRAVIAACIAPQSAGVDLAQPVLGSVLIDRVRSVVRQHMASPDFGPEGLVQLLAMSRSKLYRLLEPSGGVAHFINRERLHEARRRLREPSETLSIRAIGSDVGFVDHSTFSRAFRREFGCSPTEARAHGFPGCSGT